MEEAERLVDGVRQELTDLIMELRPQDIEDKTIDEILSDYILDWTQQHEFEIELDLQEDLQMSISTKQTLLRILQESLANIARHSQGTKVAISLAVDGADKILVVKDDGVGFEPEKVTRGVGLHSMHERAESLGGKMQVKSKSGRGTTVEVRVPKES